MDTQHQETEATHASNEPFKDNNQGVINPPIYRASTVLFRTLAELRASDKDKFTGLHYGIYGTQTTFAYEEAIAKLEGADKSITVPSGLAAVTTSLMAFLNPGDHLLMVDSTYGPTRKFCDSILAKYNIATTYYDPLVGASIAELVRPNTKVIYLESPGSNSFEIQDIPAIQAVAKARNIVTILDNTWATPYFFKAFEHGVDISLHAATKYIGGHADLMLGSINTRKEYYRRLKIQVHGLGMCVSPDDCWMALRGLRTMPTRLKQHEANALELAQWLQKRPEVKSVLHPAFPDHPGHAFWKRDFRGSSGLFAVELFPKNDAQIAAMIDHMELFGLGYSWGGYESLILPVHEDMSRSAAPKRTTGPILRLHAGLEHLEDMKKDLEAGFHRMGKTA